MLKAARLAETWNLTRGSIAQMVREGMPLTSEADAEAWRRKRYPAQALRGGSGTSGTSGSAKKLSVRNKDHSEIRRRAKKQEQTAWKLLEAAIASRSASEISAARRGYEQAATLLLTLDKALNQFAVETCDLVPAAEAKRLIVTGLAPIRTQLKTWPAALSTQLNPSDPNHANRVLEKHILDLFAQIETALNGEFATK